MAKKANALASTIKNNRDRLASLMLLSEIDEDNSKAYLQNYALLSDSLQIEDRRIRNKFTRISFETDKYVEETERLSQQRIIISISAGIAILILSLSYFLIRQRSKNKELIFETKQQQYNEAIYELILEQQSKLEEGRLEERHRISEELHDGILSKLFGTRMSMGFLDIDDDNTRKEHEQYLEEIQGIEKDIRTISHELKNEILSTKLSFDAIIESLVKDQSSIGKYDFLIEKEEAIHWNQVNDKIKINVYRILQEGLHNINKYSHAKKVVIGFKMNGKILKLSLIDNGVGFDVKTNKKGIGLSNMRSRSKALGGKFSIKSVKRKGTEITILLPV